MIMTMTTTMIDDNLVVGAGDADDDVWLQRNSSDCWRKTFCLRVRNRSCVQRQLESSRRPSSSLPMGHF